MSREIFNVVIALSWLITNSLCLVRVGMGWSTWPKADTWIFGMGVVLNTIALGLAVFALALKGYK